jgi:hypothetical protein
MNLYQHLSRVVTKGRTFVPQIDGLRFVTIIAVQATTVLPGAHLRADLATLARACQHGRHLSLNPHGPST